MSKKKHLIIGCGSAAIAAIGKIRELAPEDDIKVVTREETLPYSPTALPYLLSGRIKEENFWMKDDAYFDRMRVIFARGKEVTQISCGNKTVVYKDGDSDHYDNLLVATGAKPTKSDVPGMKELCFGGFHTMEDCRRLIHELQDKRTVTIYGGGLVAMEIAEALMERGCLVKLIVRSRVLRSYFDEQASAIIHNLFLAAGAQIFIGSEVQEVKPGKDRIEVYLADGTLLDTDILINALGVRAAADFLSGTNVKINRGMLVDENMKTSVEGIYAAGDVAEGVDFFSGKMVLNAILPSAVDQGTVAGANMAGGDMKYAGDISMNVFNFLGNSAVSIGLDSSQNSEATVMQEMDSRNNQYKKMVFENGCLVGVTLLNMNVDPGIFLYIIKNKIKVEKNRELLYEKPRETSRWLMLQNERG